MTGPSPSKDTVVIDGAELKSVRNNRQLTQDDLAAEVGITQQYVSALENRARGSVTREVAIALAKALGVGVSALQARKPPWSPFSLGVLHYHGAIKRVEDEPVIEGLRTLLQLMDGLDEAQKTAAVDLARLFLEWQRLQIEKGYREK